MPSYELDITFDNAGLTALAAAGQKVTIVKQSSGGKPTAWITFTPQAQNTVTWTEQYSVYSSTINAQSGAVIVTSSQTSAIAGSSYSLNTSGFFDPGIPGVVGPTQYQVVNNDPNLVIGTTAMVTSGLLQGAMRMIEQEGSGVVVALHAAAPGSLSRAIDLRSGKPAEAGDAVRGYGTGAQILAALGIHDMLLLSNSRHSPVGLSGYGLAIVEERPIEVDG